VRADTSASNHNYEGGPELRKTFVCEENAVAGELFQDKLYEHSICQRQCSTKIGILNGVITFIIISLLRPARKSCAALIFLGPAWSRSCNAMFIQSLCAVFFIDFGNRVFQPLHGFSSSEFLETEYRTRHSSSGDYRSRGKLSLVGATLSLNPRGHIEQSEIALQEAESRRLSVV
jgi:hypothetical protein